MSSPSSTIRDTVRETARDAKDAARESGRAASAASEDIQADLQALRDDVTRLASQITDIFAAKGTAAWARAKSNVEDVVSDVSAKGQEAVDAVRHQLTDSSDSRRNRHHSARHRFKCGQAERLHFARKQ